MKLIILTLIVLITCSEDSSFETRAISKDNYQPVVVLELFTSQGCSSCPAADVLLEKTQLANSDKKVITMSYHVDYWNYIGWKDPYSKAEYSDKQRKYSQKFKSSSYTPELVINGKEHFVGSNEGVLRNKLSSYSNAKVENAIKLTNVIKNDKLISFDFTIDGSTDEKYVEIALVIDERTTQISRGENKNRTLKNINIVVETKRLSLNGSTGKGSITLPEIVKVSDHLKLIALIKNADLDIVSADQVKL